MMAADVLKAAEKRLEAAYYANTERLVKDDGIDPIEQRGVCRGIAMAREMVMEMAKRPSALQDVV